MRFCINWQIYADDITVRTGRWLNGVYYSDSEHTERIRAASRTERAAQPVLEEAFKALGFDPAALGKEVDGKAVKPKARSRTRGEKADDGLGAEAGADPSPRAHGVMHFVLLVVAAFFGSNWEKNIYISDRARGLPFLPLLMLLDSPIRVSAVSSPLTAPRLSDLSVLHSSVARDDMSTDPPPELREGWEVAERKDGRRGLLLPI